jgi:hypothetical protein
VVGDGGYPRKEAAVHAQLVDVCRAVELALGAHRAGVQFVEPGVDAGIGTAGSYAGPPGTSEVVVGIDQCRKDQVPAQVCAGAHRRLCVHELVTGHGQIRVREDLGGSDEGGVDQTVGVLIGHGSSF